MVGVVIRDFRSPLFLGHDDGHSDETHHYFRQYPTPAVLLTVVLAAVVVVDQYPSCRLPSLQEGKPINQITPRL